MTDDFELQVRHRMANDFPWYAAKNLRIRTKVGSIEPLVLNREQMYLHKLAQEDLRTKGYVRNIILKGRQQGCSTYVEARFFHKVTHRKGVRAFILTHHAEATANLFGMAKRYYENSLPWYRPTVGASSAKELAFPALDSGYKVGTAGTEGVGRSDTIQYFHGSEVAFWPNAAEHAAGALQAVPTAPLTEVWLESTANGVGNFFHQKWQEAEVGANEFRPVFIPWFWQAGYSIEPPEDFTLTSEDKEHMDAHSLTLGQMAWRQRKIAELGSDWLFMREYPATPLEAFATSGDDTFISSRLVFAARRAKDVEAYGPLVLGVDPARFGDDRTAIAYRIGRVCEKIEAYSGLDTMEVVGVVGRIINERHPRRVFVDVGGLGAGVVDRLRELGHGAVIVPVNGGEKPTSHESYFNKRAEMWGEMKKWLEDAPVSLPDRDTLHADLTGLLFKYDSLSRLKLETKDDMKKRGLRSPDEADALALTFAHPVAMPARGERYGRSRRRLDRRGTHMGV